MTTLTRELKSGARHAGSEPEHSSGEAGARGGASLGNNANNLSPLSGRAQKYALRNSIQQVTKLDRVRKCGRVPVAGWVSLKSGENGERASFGSLCTCASVWACPVCAAKISARRSADLEHVLSHAVAEQKTISMVTLTMRHNAGHRLKDLWNALSSSWQAIVSGKRWAKIKAELGLVGFAKAVEITHGEHGWHVHLHAVLISDNAPSETVQAYFFSKWKNALARKGLDCLSGPGMQWDVAKNDQAIARYVTKLGGSLAKEATLGAFKKGRHTSRTPFQIAEDFAQTGDVEDVCLWLEYEKVSRGRRAFTWSKGIREWAGLLREKTDEEVAAEEYGDAVRALISKNEWRKLHPVAFEVLDIIEKSGIAAGLAHLDNLGVKWWPPGAVEAGLVPYESPE